MQAPVRYFLVVRVDFVVFTAFLTGFLAVVLRAKRPFAGMASASIALACSCVMVLGSVSFGILAFFLPSVIYGP
ncbi:hypothetical protein D3C72_2384100 [compost metagenome]